MDSEGDEISISELKRMMIRTNNEMKEDMQKQLNEIKDNIKNSQMNSMRIETSK
jgi:hypothetical protein